jgi:hypothetical protein
VRLWRAASAVRGRHTALGPRDGGDRAAWTLERVAVAEFAGGKHGIKLGLAADLASTRCVARLLPEHSARSPSCVFLLLQK